MSNWVAWKPWRSRPTASKCWPEELSTAIWSAAPIVWNDPDRAAEKLRLAAAIERRLPEPHPHVVREPAAARSAGKARRERCAGAAALAATQANWHASRQAWPEAAAAFDRLMAADPTAPEAWLRTPGLLRLATALLHQNRPGDAAALLSGGAKRRAQDGLPAVEQAGAGVQDAATGELLGPLRALIKERLASEPRNPGLLELRAQLAGQWSDTKAQVADYTAAIREACPAETRAHGRPQAALYTPGQFARRLGAVGTGGRRLCSRRDRRDDRPCLAIEPGVALYHIHGDVKAILALVERQSEAGGLSRGSFHAGQGLVAR